MTTILQDSYAGPGARHEALLYTSADEFASLTAPFVAEGLANDESAVVVTSRENLEAFRTALNEPSPLVFLLDGDDWYRNPAETVGRWVGFVEGQVSRGRSRVRGVGEIAPLRRGQAVREWLHYESILNTLLTPLPLWVLCAYNTEVLGESMIDEVRRSHPTVIEAGSASASESYLPPPSTVAAQPLALDARRPLTHEPVDVADTCAYVEATARRAGLPEWQVQQLIAAVGEVAHNAFLHGRAPVFVTAWEEQGSFVCQVEDDGPGIVDPAAGYWPPTNGNGWGLWLARQVTDSLEIGRGPYGSAVRLTMHRSLQKAPRGALTTRL